MATKYGPGPPLGEPPSHVKNSASSATQVGGHTATTEATHFPIPARQLTFSRSEKAARNLSTFGRITAEQ
jgi:hypothetical protein